VLALRSGDAAVCDGSFKQGVRTVAWIIEDVKGIRVRGWTISPGGEQVQSTYRSELVGILPVHGNGQIHMPIS
jgi:hypothetical protein